MNAREQYTPTTESVEDCYAMDPESEYRDPINYASTVRENRRAFRRWLAEHDRQVWGDGYRLGVLDERESAANEEWSGGLHIKYEPARQNPYGAAPTENGEKP